MTRLGFWPSGESSEKSPKPLVWLFDPPRIPVKKAENLSRGKAVGRQRGGNVLGAHAGSVGVRGKWRQDVSLAIRRGCGKGQIFLADYCEGFAI